MKNQVPIIPQTTEFIHGGLYYRSSKVPKGTLVIGCEHKKDSIAFLLSGTIKQIDGENTYTISAPYVLQTTKDSNRKAYAMTDVEYATVTQSNTKNLDEVEDEMYNQHSINKFVRDDFKAMLIGYNVTPKDVEEDMKTIDVVITESELYRLDISGISGYGVFLTKAIEKGHVIGEAMIGEKKTQLGRYVNHCPYPNCKYNEKLQLVSLYDIGPNVELTVNYRNTLDKIFIGEV